MSGMGVVAPAALMAGSMAGLVAVAGESHGDLRPWPISSE